MNFYTFILERFHIDNTRSRHQDTDTVTFGLRIGEQQFSTQSLFAGDVNNGDHRIGLMFARILVTDSSRPAIIGYEIYNGNASQSSIDLTAIEQALLDKAGQLFLDSLAADTPFWSISTSQSGGDVPDSSNGSFSPIVDAPDWSDSFFEVAYASIGSFISPDCDGFVAGDAIAQLTNQWDALIDAAGGITFEQTMSYPGTASPAGCGSNSNYSVTWSVTRERVKGSMRKFIALNNLQLTPGLRSLTQHAVTS